MHSLRSLMSHGADLLYQIKLPIFLLAGLVFAIAYVLIIGLSPVYAQSSVYILAKDFNGTVIPYGGITSSSNISFRFSVPFLSVASQFGQQSSVYPPFSFPPLSADVQCKISYGPGATCPTDLRCSLDNGPWSRCVYGVEYPEILDGDHVLRVKVVDSAGGVSLYNFNWTRRG